MKENARAGKGRAHRCGDEDCTCLENSTRENRIILIARLAAAVVFFGLSFVSSFGTVVCTVLGVAAFLCAGFDILKEAVESVLRRDYFNENTLMTVAGVCALCIGQPHEAVLIMLFSQAGEILEERAVTNSRSSIEELLKLSPETVNIQEDGAIKAVPADSLRPGDTFMVFAGERIGLDGVVLSGSTEIDTSSLTGESVPVPAEKGSEVLSGCMNVSGTISVRATREAGDSAAAKIVKLVQDAKSSKGEADRFITRFSRYYTPCVFAAALLIAVFVPLIFRLPYSVWIHRALVLLVVSCPCALVISVPLSYFAGIGGASRHGILFKNAAAIDGLSRAKYAAFDKTGTLTNGKFRVTEARPANGLTAEELMTLAVYAEASSKHPLAQSIVEHADVRPDVRKIKYARELSGKGCIAELINGQRIAAGNLAFMRELGVSDDIEPPESAVVYVAAAGRYCGCILLADQVRSDAKKAVDSLFDLDVEKVAIITGDSKTGTQSVAAALDIGEVYSGCLPEDKLKVIETMKKKTAGKGTVLYTGDGINDAPVITAADVGIAMGALGSDAAIAAADVVVTTDEIAKVPEAVRLAQGIRRIVFENISFALAVKIIIMAFGLAGIAPMWLAVFADVGVAILAILNAMRCLKK